MAIAAARQRRDGAGALLRGLVGRGAGQLALRAIDRERTPGERLRRVKQRGRNMSCDGRIPQIHTSPIRPSARPAMCSRSHILPHRPMQNARRLLAAGPVRKFRSAPAKPGRQQIKLGRIGAARRRLDVLDAGEIALELGEQRRLGAALQHLARGRRRPAPAPRAAKSAAASASAMICRWSVLRWPVAFAAMSDSTTSAAPPSMALSRSGAVGVEKIELQEIDAGDRRHLEKIDRDHAARCLADAARLPRPGSSRRARRRDRPRARRA